MNRKTLATLTLGGLLAVMATTALIGPSNAQRRPGGIHVDPNVVFKSCDTGFRKTGRGSYTCLKIFRRLCKPGHAASRPYLRRLRDGRYMVVYRCLRGPR